MRREKRSQLRPVANTTSPTVTNGASRHVPSRPVTRDVTLVNYVRRRHDLLTIYRKRLDGGTRFERCEAGLPKWFDDNIDTACLAAVGALVVFGTGDGRVFRSLDAGEHWELAVKGLPPVRCVVVV